MRKLFKKTAMRFQNTLGIYLGFVMAGILITSCDLTELPQDTATKQQVFQDENGLQLYTNSFYNMLPSADDITRGDAMSDYGARRDVPLFLRQGAYGPSTTSGWDWDNLRNINYFLANNKNQNISEEVRQHYNGIARFFRAYFYFQKVKRYGDVPWISNPLEVDDPELYDSRDERGEVMDSVLIDINFAIDNINEGNDPSRTRITKDVALALKSRISLFEGTFRKYHADDLASDLEGTSEDWLEEAVESSEEIMERGNFSIYNSGNNPYRQLFKTDSPNDQEDILTVVHDTETDVLHAANWWYTSSTYGVRLSFIRQFVNTYLNIDGTPFTDEPNYQSKTFTEEVKNRDRRLAQTIRTPGYTRIDAGEAVPTPPDFAYTYTGYHPHKWTLEDQSYDGWVNNTNSVPIFRYAEILLNYAEAKAELGTITDSDWDQTIGTLRRRAGITDRTSALPTQIDPYMQQTYFPNISDPVLIEIRRERSIELALEGFRFDDIRRWRKGELMEMEWNGMYVEELNESIDLNEDGDPDVYFHDNNPPDSEDEIEGVIYLNISEDFGLTDQNELTWRRDIEKNWEPKKYLYPIPETDIQTNPDLGQNPGW